MASSLFAYDNKALFAAAPEPAAPSPAPAAKPPKPIEPEFAPPSEEELGWASSKYAGATALSSADFAAAQAAQKPPELTEEEVRRAMEARLQSYQGATAIGSNMLRGDGEARR